MSRGNGRSIVFHDDADHGRFEDLMRRASERIPMRVLAWCLMPNHVHLVLWPYFDGDLGRWMHWLLTSHVLGHRRRYETIGRIWQGRFTAPPIQQDHHLLVVLRYVERNPVRAGLVDRAEKWPWSSLRRRGKPDSVLAASPVSLPDPWDDWVNAPLTSAETAAVRTSIERGSPYGDAAWTRGTADRLGLQSTLRSPGRPRSLPRRT